MQKETTVEARRFPNHSAVYNQKSDLDMSINALLPAFQTMVQKIIQHLKQKSHQKWGFSLLLKRAVLEQTGGINTLHSV